MFGVHPLPNQPYSRLDRTRAKRMIWGDLAIDWNCLLE